MRIYRVIDLRPEHPLELAMQADTSEGAARATLGIDVVPGRATSAPWLPYFETDGGLSTVRRYARVDGRWVNPLYPLVSGRRPAGDPIAFTP